MKNNLPFKRPFKGKGAIIESRDSAYSAMVLIEKEMRLLIEKYNDAFRRPRAITLVNKYHSRGQGRWNKIYYSRLLWRASQVAFGHQRFICLFTTEVGELLLARLSPAMRQSLRDFEAKRLDMNFRMSLAYAQWRNADHYIEQYDSMHESAQIDMPGRKTATLDYNLSAYD